MFKGYHINFYVESPFLIGKNLLCYSSHRPSVGEIYREVICWYDILVLNNFSLRRDETGFPSVILKGKITLTEKGPRGTCHFVDKKDFKFSFFSHRGCYTFKFDVN